MRPPLITLLSCVILLTICDTAWSTPFLHHHATASTAPVPRDLREMSSSNSRADTWANAARDGRVGPLKVHFDFSALDQAAANDHCVHGTGELATSADPRLGQVRCGPWDVPTSEKIALMGKRVAWLRNFVARAFQVRKRAGGANFGVDMSACALNSGCNAFSLASKTRLVDADMVVIMTAFPCADAMHASATCLVKNPGQVSIPTPHGCLIGAINWCPHKLHPNMAHRAQHRTNDLHTALHEMMHLLGCCGHGIVPFYGPNLAALGNLADDAMVPVLPASEVFTDVFLLEKGVSGKEAHRRVRYLSTPNVVRIAQEQFACADLEGVPLEDDSAGAGAHWEARVLGSECMAYGEHSGEVYISDITLACIEDAGLYFPNYTVAGRLAPVSGHVYNDANGLVQSISTALFPTEIASTVAGHQNQSSPGHIRWGRNQGCAFVRQLNIWHPGSEGFQRWSEASRYVCQPPAEVGESTNGCSSDNRGTALCTSRSWAGSQATGKFNCVGHVCQQNSEGTALPLPFQHIAGSSSLGGLSPFMDFVPFNFVVEICGDTDRTEKIDDAQEVWDPVSVSSNATRDMAQPASVHINIVKEQADVSGAQVYCKDCRCLQSSLARVWESSNAVHGRCYKINCPSAAYLQVGVLGPQGKLIWYGCRGRDGGKLFIPGWIGSLRCPTDAVSFCRYEDVSHRVMQETSLAVEWILLVGLPIVGIICVFLCSKRLARRWARQRTGETKTAHTHEGIPRHKHGPPTAEPADINVRPRMRSTTKFSIIKTDEDGDEAITEVVKSIAPMPRPRMPTIRAAADVEEDVAKAVSTVVMRRLNNPK